MTTALLSLPIFRAFDSAGLPLAGGLLYSYAANTLTFQNTYSDNAGSSPNTNPVVLDSTGSAVVRLDPTLVYKFVLKTSAGTTLWTVDYYQADNLTASSIGAILYPQTAAEIAAGVTPTNYGYAPGDVRRFGADPTGVADSTTSIQNAILVAAQSTGNTITFPAGTFKVTSGLSLTDSTTLQGAGMFSTTLVYTGSSALLTFPSTSGRNTVRDLTLQGTGKTGTGLQIGDTNFSGMHSLDRVQIKTFATGLRLAGALWTTISRCYIQGNTTGVDFNAGWGAGYSTTVAFFANRIAANDHEGVAASNVPVRNQSITFIGGSIEQNCVTDLTRYQHVLGAVEQLSLINVYYEYSAGGTKPNGINLDSAGPFTIQDCYFNTQNNAIKSTSASQGRIDGCRFIGSTTKDIDISAGCSYIEIGTSNNFSAASYTVAGATNFVYAYPKAQQVNTVTVFTPTLKGAGTAGTPTYTLQNGTYTKVGNLVFFQIRVTISAKGGMAGAISLEGLPLTSNTQTGTAATFSAHFDGVTVSAGNTAFHAELPNNSTSIQLYQSGSATAAQIVDTQLAAATTVYLSGCYQTAS